MQLHIQRQQRIANKFSPAVVYLWHQLFVLLRGDCKCPQKNCFEKRKFNFSCYLGPGQSKKHPQGVIFHVWVFFVGEIGSGRVLGWTFKRKSWSGNFFCSALVCFGSRVDNRCRMLKNWDSPGRGKVNGDIEDQNLNGNSIKERGGNEWIFPNIWCIFKCLESKLD